MAHLLQTARGHLATDECYVVPVLLALLGIGCGNTIAARRPLSREALTEINEVLDERPAVVTLRAREPEPTSEVNVRDVRVASDTVSWLESEGPSASEIRQTTVPTNTVKQIFVRRSGKGAAEGALFGVLLGVAGGALIGLAAAPSGNCNDNAGCLYAPIGAGVGLIIGPLIGALVGAAIGHRTTVEFDEAGPSAGAPNK
jgi:hypothetical protein